MKIILLTFMFLGVAACSNKHDTHPKKIQPAKIEAREGEKIPYVILTVEAEKRIGIEILPQAVPMPTSAMILDVNGKTWVYTQTAPQTYHRVPVDEKTTAPLVTVGAAELFGAESGVGK